MSPTATTAPSNLPAVDADADAVFDLDVHIVESGPVIAELLRSTSDNCGATCASACTSCRS
ncbi:MAG: FxLD family lanthipeptide [Micromonosporaceae bacterium]|nr:FxLD family lanthipeptide [Micromonosporaceae bacterium]